MLQSKPSLNCHWRAIAGSHAFVHCDNVQTFVRLCMELMHLGQVGLSWSLRSLVKDDHVKSLTGDIAVTICEWL